MKHGPRLALGALLLVAGVAVMPASAGAGQADADALVSLGAPSRVPPGAHAGGVVADSTPVHLVVTLKPRDPDALDKAVQAVSEPGSPRYRRYLTTAEFAQRFGASDAAIEQVRSGLQAMGLEPGTLSANRLSIALDTTAKKAGSAFHTSLRSYRTADGHHGFTNDQAPRLPAGLASQVAGIFGLATSPVARPLNTSIAGPSTRVSSTAGSTRAMASAGVPVACSAAATAAATYGGANPADLLSAYSASNLVSAGHNGGGQNVAVLSLQTLESTDIDVYRQCFGSTGPVIQNVIDGGADASDGTDEATLDVETIMGLAPAATIHFYEAPNTDSGWYDNMSAIVNDNVARTVSISWGLCEADMYQLSGPGGTSLIDAEYNLIAQGALQGQSFFASSGDSGSAACEPDGDNALAVNDPASQPLVTAVGGTTLSTTTAPPAETVWNNQLGASGGGVSNYWWKPTFQPVTPEGHDTDGSLCGNQGDYCRTVPDVAASADPSVHGLMIYSNGEWVPFGGTSVASPQWAALTADMNSSCPNVDGFGSLNATLYGAPASAFNDVTTGDNDFTGTNSGLYQARSGYDLATGRGTPIVANLTATLCAHTPSLTNVEAFVLATYVDFTGSIPFDDPSDPVDYWINAITNGTPRLTLIDALAHSDAWVAHIVNGFYTDTLGRGPDASGLGYWEYIIESGRMSVAQVAAQFYASSEYFRRDHNSASVWIDDLYGKLLGRSPDSAASYWVTQTAVKGRAWVAYSFYQSSESRRTRVKNLYLRLLHRDPTASDPSGLNYWADVIATKGDIALAMNLANSQEYFDNATARFPG